MNENDAVAATCYGHYAAFQTFRAETGQTKWVEQEHHIQLFVSAFENALQGGQQGQPIRAIASKARDQTLETLHRIVAGKDVDLGNSFLASRESLCMGSIGLGPDDR